MSKRLTTPEAGIESIFKKGKWAIPDGFVVQGNGSRWTSGRKLVFFVDDRPEFRILGLRNCNRGKVRS
jgi:hypothetical protein